MLPGPLEKAGTPVWITFAILGLTTAALSKGAQYRTWLIAGLLVLLATGAAGCGSNSGSGPSSMQTVTVVAATSAISVNATPLLEVAGLLLKIGTIFGR
jgi:hypothetical protein